MIQVINDNYNYNLSIVQFAGLLFWANDAVIPLTLYMKGVEWVKIIN